MDSMTPPGSRLTLSPIERVRSRFGDLGIDALLVPIADRFLSSPIADHDQRVAWLTGYRGSPGLVAVTHTRAALLVGDRDRLEATLQVDADHVIVLTQTNDALVTWLMADGEPQPVQTVGYDPALHTAAAIADLEDVLAGNNLALSPVTGLVDALWPDQPSRPRGRLIPHPETCAGESSQAKRARIAARLHETGAASLLIAKPESLAWLLNVRGEFVPHNPIPHGYGLLSAKGRFHLFVDCADHPFDRASGDDIQLAELAATEAALRTLTGTVQYDSRQTPAHLAHWLQESDAELVDRPDPCLAGMAIRNPTELQGFRDAHHRDGLAMVNFLHWFGAQDHETLHEWDVARAVDRFRRAAPSCLETSFPTIAAVGPNAAIIHYRAVPGDDRVLQDGGSILIDSGGQYQDGTTDVTRTLAIGPAVQCLTRRYTSVLKALIMLSTACWPAREPAGSLDALARYHLWKMGQDYPHGTGHGVGHWLNVHAGVSNISRRLSEPLQVGMVVTIEPGWYEEGVGGVRLENMAIVTPAPGLDGDGTMLTFETITRVPFDRRLVCGDMLDRHEVDWFNRYHADVLDRLAPDLSRDAAAWLAAATAPSGG